MDCGAAEGIKKLTDKIDALEDKFDSMIDESPLGELNELQGKMQEGMDGLMADLEGMIPSMSFPKAPAGSLLADIGSLAKSLSLGAIAAPGIVGQIQATKRKWEGITAGGLDSLGGVDGLVSLLQTGAMDIDNLCKMVPNLSMDGLDISVKGVPTTWPEIDIKTILKGGKLPEFPIPVFEIEAGINEAIGEVTDEWLNVELPKFKIGKDG